VRCTFSEDGVPVFTDADIPMLKKTSKVKFADLLHAVRRVNGLDIPAAEKKSEADQPSG
jgi:hypothetical protein